MNIKKILISLAFVFTLFTVSAYAKTLEFTIDINKVNVKQSHIVTAEELLASPYIESDRTMVPVRVISEKLGAKIGWNEAERKVTITQNGKNIVLQIDSKIAEVNGVATELDTAPVIKNDTTMVPLRFVSENLGYNVQYIQPTRQVVVTNNSHVATVGGTNVPYDVYEIMHDIYLASFYGTYSEVEIVEQAMLYLKDLYAIYDNAIAFGVTLSDSDNVEIQKALSEDMANLSPSWLTSAYTDLLCKMKVVENYQLYISQLVYQADINPEKFYNDHYVQVKDVYISKTKSDAKKIAMEVAGKASRGTDFDVLMEKYSDANIDKDIVEYGYVVTDGDMPAEYMAAARELEVGKVSGIVETASGYYIIKKLELTPYSPEFDTVLYTTAADMSFENFMNSIVENVRYVQNMTTSEIINKLNE